MVPFSRSERTYNTYPWIKIDLHGFNRETIEPGIVGTAINGTIRLQSDFEVRCSSLLSSNPYIHHFDISGSWLAIHAQLALGNPSHVSSNHTFHPNDYDNLNGWTRNHFQSTTVWWSVNSVMPSSKWVTWVRRAIRLVMDDVSNFILLLVATNHASHSWPTAVQSSPNPRLSKITFSSLPANSSLTSTNL